MKKILILLFALLLIPLLNNAHANLLTNSGFDTGVQAPWTENSPGNTDTSVTIEQYLSPNYSAKFRAWNGTNPQTATLRQGFAISPNTLYFASAYLRSLQSTALRDGAYAWISIDWYTASNGTNLGTMSSSQLLTFNSDWEFFEIDGISPSNANYARMYLNLYSPAMTGANRIVYFDNIRVDLTSAVPEPASLSLLGLGLLGLIFKGKRKEGTKI